MIFISASDEESVDMSVSSYEGDLDLADGPLLVVADAFPSAAALAERPEEHIYVLSAAREDSASDDDNVLLPDLNADEGTEVVPLEADASANDEEDDKHDEKEESPVKVLPKDTSMDDDGQICMICFEPWTSSNEHRLVSLRCGHLFGRSCISKWLRGQGSRCPQCNARARKSEIRPIYARCLKALDTSERDQALKDLERESQLRKKAELECAQMRIRYQMAVQECELVKKQLIETQMLLNESRSSNICLDKFSNIGKSHTSPFMICSNIELAGGCRILDCNDILGMMVVSQPSSNQIFKGFGLRKMSIPDMKVCEYVHLHQKPIKDVSFHSHNGLVLTASLDKTLKLTNCLNNSLVQMYNVDCEAWSCAWDLDDPCYFFAGVRTGIVYVFDIRMTDRYVEQLQGLGEASPVVSIQYIKRQPMAASSNCGPLVGQLASCVYYQKHGPTSYEINQIPLEGKFTSLSYEFTTNHLLASCRPSLRHPCVTHTLCELAYEGSSFQCNLIQSMTGGSTQVQLTRSRLIPHPDNDSSVLVCAGDEEAKAALVWDGSNGALLDSLKSESPILDVSTFHNGHKPVLVTLSEKNLRTYSWSRA